MKLAPTQEVFSALSTQLKDSPAACLLTKNNQHQAEYTAPRQNTGFTADFPHSSMLDTSFFLDDLQRSKILPLPTTAMDEALNATNKTDGETGNGMLLAAHVAAAEKANVILGSNNNNNPQGGQGGASSTTTTTTAAPMATQAGALPKGLAKKAKKAALQAAATTGGTPVGAALPPATQQPKKITENDIILPSFMSSAATGRYQCPKDGWHQTAINNAAPTQQLGGNDLLEAAATMKTQRFATALASHAVTVASIPCELSSAVPLATMQSGDFAHSEFDKKAAAGASEVGGEEDKVTYHEFWLNDFETVVAQPSAFLMDLSTTLAALAALNKQPSPATVSPHKKSGMKHVVAIRGLAEIFAVAGSFEQSNPQLALLVDVANYALHLVASALRTLNNNSSNSSNGSLSWRALVILPSTLTNSLRDQLRLYFDKIFNTAIATVDLSLAPSSAVLPAALHVLSTMKAEKEVHEPDQLPFEDDDEDDEEKVTEQFLFRIPEKNWHFVGKIARATDGDDDAADDDHGEEEQQEEQQQHIASPQHQQSQNIQERIVALHNDLVAKVDDKLDEEENDDDDDKATKMSFAQKDIVFVVVASGEEAQQVSAKVADAYTVDPVKTMCLVPEVLVSKTALEASEKKNEKAGNDLESKLDRAAAAAIAANVEGDDDDNAATRRRESLLPVFVVTTPTQLFGLHSDATLQKELVSQFNVSQSIVFNANHVIVSSNASSPVVSLEFTASLVHHAAQLINTNSASKAKPTVHVMLPVESPTATNLMNVNLFSASASSTQKRNNQDHTTTERCGSFAVRAELLLSLTTYTKPNTQQFNTMSATGNREPSFAFNEALFLSPFLAGSSASSSPSSAAPPLSSSAPSASVARHQRLLQIMKSCKTNNNVTADTVKDATSQLQAFIVSEKKKALNPFNNTAEQNTTPPAVTPSCSTLQGLFAFLRASGCFRQVFVSDEATKAGLLVAAVTPIGRLCARCVTPPSTSSANKCCLVGARVMTGSLNISGVKMILVALSTTGRLPASNTSSSSDASSVVDTAILEAAKLSWEQEVLLRCGTFFAPSNADSKDEEEHNKTTSPFAAALQKSKTLMESIMTQLLQTKADPNQQAPPSLRSTFPDLLMDRVRAASAASSAAASTSSATPSSIIAAFNTEDEDNVSLYSSLRSGIVAHGTAPRAKVLRMCALSAAAPYLFLFGCAPTNPLSVSVTRSHGLVEHSFFSYLAKTMLSPSASANNNHRQNWTVSRCELLLLCGDAIRKQLTTPPVHHTAQQQLSAKSTMSRGYFVSAPLTLGLSKGASDTNKQVVFDAFAKEEMADEERRLADKLRQQEAEEQARANTLAQDEAVLQGRLNRKQEVSDTLQTATDIAAAQRKKQQQQRAAGGGTVEDVVEYNAGDRFIPTKMAAGGKARFCDVILHPTAEAKQQQQQQQNKKGGMTADKKSTCGSGVSPMFTFTVPTGISDVLLSVALALRVSITNNAIVLENALVSSLHNKRGQDGSGGGATSTTLNLTAIPVDILQSPVVQSMILPSMFIFPPSNKKNKDGGESGGEAKKKVSPEQKAYDEALAVAQAASGGKLAPTSWVDGVFNALQQSSETQYDRLTLTLHEQTNLIFRGCRDDVASANAMKRIRLEAALADGGAGNGGDGTKNTTSGILAPFIGDEPNDGEILKDVMQATAEKVAKKGGGPATEKEIEKLKTKALEKKNTTLAFLDKSHRYHPYFQYLVKQKLLMSL